MPLKQDLKEAFSVNRRTFMNPSGWFGIGLFATQIQVTVRLIKSMLVPAEPVRQETFEQALVRLNLKESDLAKIAQRYLLYALSFGLLGVAILCYGIFLAARHDSLAGLILSIAAAAVSAANAFRFHFLYFQIRHRKLGCTVEEWLSGKPNGGGSR